VVSSEKVEAPTHRPASLSDVWRELDASTLASALVAFLFAATGPVALMFAAAMKGGVGETGLAAWIFGGFFFNGLISIGFSLYYRQPLVLLWTMPGVVLVGQALTHLTMPEVIGAYIATGVLMLVLGLTGLVGRIMRAIPMPIVMGMVAGVFLQFGIDWLKSFQDAFWIAAPMTAVFAALMALPRLARLVPPLIAAMVVGVVATLLTGAVGTEVGATAAPLSSLSLVPPMPVMPVLSWAAIAELTIPLAVAVLAAQNAQGYAILHATGHKAPVDSVTIGCGVGSLVTAPFGTVPTCLAGPVSALVVAGNPPQKHYVSAVVTSVLIVSFGVFAPVFARLSVVAPRALIACLAGLAMLKVLQSAFDAAFKGPNQLGALISFIVTVAAIPILNVGAPFWGLVFGYIATRLFDAAPAKP
jgi:benzoate membrane transport protein